MRVKTNNHKNFDVESQRLCNRVCPGRVTGKKTEGAGLAVQKSIVNCYVKGNNR